MNLQPRSEGLQLHQICNNLLNYRSQVNDKEEFARTVIDNLFGNEAIDLLQLGFTDPTVEEAYNNLLTLIGINSMVFKTIYSNDSLFDDFIWILCDHAVRSKASAAQVPRSIYSSIIQIYLEHVLPITEQNLNFMKNSGWFSAPLSCNPSTCVSSPRKLLRPEVLAASQPLELTGIRSVSLRSVYPRLLQFVGNLITNLASLRAWPSVAQFVVLKMVLKYYHDFLLADTDDSDFCSLKLMLIQKPLFVNLLQHFLERVLMNWQFDDSYIKIIELWMCLVYHPALIHYKQEKFVIFLRASTDYFIELFELIVSRVVDAEPESITETNILSYIEDHVFAIDEFNKVFRHYNIHMSEYINLIRIRLLKIKSEKESAQSERESNSQGLFYKLINYVAGFFHQSTIDMYFLEQHSRKLQDLSQKATNTQ